MAFLLAVLDDPKAQSWLPLVLLAVAAGALGFAFHAQYALGLEPCNLCLAQRVPYAVIGVLAGFALIRPGGAARRAVVLVAGIAFAAGSAVAVYHVGVEQHWWASAVCGGDLAKQSSTISDLLAGLRAPPEKSCDQVDWTFLGLSIATYNAAFSAAMAGLCLIAAGRMRKRV
ncbi:MAG: disulfide bond formation protein B [Rhodospirillaceae bacterium]